MLTVLRWEEPPPAKGNHRSGSIPRGSKYDMIAVELIARPNEWAVIHEGWSRSSADNLAIRIRRGEISCFTAGEFAAVVRTVSYQYRVYARYVGEA